MAEQETKTAKFAGKKNRHQFNNQGRNQTTKTNYKSKVTELEDKVFERPSKVQQIAEEY